MKTSALNKPKRSTQGPFAIWHGMKLSGMARLLSQRPELHWSRWLRIALMPSMGIYNSVMGGLEDVIHGPRIKRTEIDHPPVFILGYWRSGTTLLHNLITADPQFTYPTTYQTFFPWHFLTTERIVSPLTSWLIPESRPMDNVKVRWNCPQEDDMALCIMTLVSPYTLLVHPGDRQDYKRSMDMGQLDPQELQSWKDALLLLMKKISIRNNKSIVLKSPSHTYRVKVLLEMFPDAKFVYIYRNPVDVFNSTCHLRRTMVEENTLGRGIVRNCEEEVIDTYVRAFDRYEQERSLIPSGNLHEVRYEDLAQDPLAEMEQIYSGLGIDGFDRLRSLLLPEIPGLKRYQKNRFNPDAYWVNRVYDECHPIFDRFGYPPPLVAERDADVVAA